VSVPPSEARERLHRIIYDELCLGRVEEPSRDQARRIVAALAEGGAEAIIFGCTEIMMLLSPSDSPVPVFDTTTIHALAAVDRALS
jgi:aspartate racemase